MEQREFGPFLIGEKLGTGGMGVVFRATYKKTGQAMAVKFLTAAAAQNERTLLRFEKELEILKQLKHPHIVRCYGGGQHGAHRFMAMEIVDGGSVAGVLRRMGRLSWEATIDYGQQVASALECAHAAGIVHRDLKPANLLLTQDGRIKLSDFGLARVLFEEGITATNHTVGTMAYMAPEQIRGQEISHRTDLYALGVVLFELLTGRTPFTGTNSAEVLFQHLQKPAPRVRTLALDCPIFLDNVIAQLLEKDAAKRPTDAATVQLMLKEALKKAGENTGVALHAAAGGASTLHSMADTKTVQKLVRRTKRREDDAEARTAPFWERPWFLALALLLVVGVVVWALWPASEATLYARAKPLMESTDPLDWDRARENYIEPLLRRFPEGTHAAEATQWIDRIEMHDTERRIQAGAKLGTPPKNEAERLYLEASRFEQFGDRVTALEKYRAIVGLMKNDEAARPVVNLARRQLAALEAQAGPTDLQSFLENQLALARAAIQSGRLVEGQRILGQILDLYENNREATAYVLEAQRLTQTAGSGLPPPMSSGGGDTRPPPTMNPPPNVPPVSAPPMSPAGAAGS